MKTRETGWLLTATLGLYLSVCALYGATQDLPLDKNETGLTVSDLRETTQLRRPVALQLSRDGKLLVVGNRTSGTIAFVDSASHMLIGEFKLGSQISDLALIPGTNVFAFADPEQHFISGFELDQEHAIVPKVLWRVATVGYPHAIRFNKSGNLMAVCGLWSRQVMIYRNPDGDTAPQQQATFATEFSPGHACWISENRLLVADAFGNSIALIDVGTGQVFASHLGGHRTGGLALSSDQQSVVFSDQRLNPLARSNRNDVHWGLMVTNQLRWLSAEELVGVTSEAGFSAVLRKFDSQPVGETGNGKADLGELAFAADGTLALTIGGVNELAIGKLDDDRIAYVPVGKRPIAVACAADSTVAFVANLLDDSISVVDLDDYKVVATVPLGPTPELSAVELGEQLFYDARLSHDRWLSCHSCHVEGHTSGLLNDNFSDETFQTPKLVISLLGHGNTLPLTWSGKHADMEIQMKRSIESTMQSDVPATDEQIERLAAFIRQLPAPPAASRARHDVDAAQLGRGQQLFEQLDCVRCHAPPTYTTPSTYDLGIRDEQGESRFNPPSLIGLGQRDRYFHDGRYGKLAELLVVGEHEVPRELTEQELSDLIVFLKSL